MAKKKMKQKCHRCKHEWEYKGVKNCNKYPQFISCPKCKTSIKLR